MAPLLTDEETWRVVCADSLQLLKELPDHCIDAVVTDPPVLMWLYGTGMPKSRRLPEGRGTALKPAYEPIVLARTPLDGTTTHNLHQHGTGALNTTACAIRPSCEGRAHPGRWPATVLLGHHHDCRPDRCTAGCPTRGIDQQRPGASRFFYCAKASRRERDAGFEHLPIHTLDLFPNARNRPGRTSRVCNPHPTVKPLALMQWLVKLATPEGGVVLDPFTGSGSTGSPHETCSDASSEWSTSRRTRTLRVPAYELHTASCPQGRLLHRSGQHEPVGRPDPVRRGRGTTAVGTRAVMKRESAEADEAVGQ